MDLLSLDLGCTTGWACWHAGKVTSCGRWVLGAEPQRYALLQEYLGLWLRDKGPAPIAYELVRRHGGTHAAHVYGGFRGCMLAVAAEWGQAVHPIEVAAAKRALTGSAKATKAEMVAAALTWWLHPVTHDTADAIGVGLAAMAQLEEDTNEKP